MSVVNPKNKLRFKLIGICCYLIELNIDPPLMQTAKLIQSASKC